MYLVEVNTNNKKMEDLKNGYKKFQFSKDYKLADKSEYDRKMDYLKYFHFRDESEEIVTEKTVTKEMEFKDYDEEGGYSQEDSQELFSEEDLSYEDYANTQDCTCGKIIKRKKFRISGGEETKPNEFPWIVRIVGGCAGMNCLFVFNPIFNNIFMQQHH